ncbi:MAG TPA: hypothetical protein VG456_25075 [Candidatus Sulfopaludibacter sp.]|nr:hypothetical protein [Candidatus Sulfopaludibacter sp.]
MRQEIHTARLESFLERPKQYNNIDGVGELGIGFMCLCFALLGWLQVHTPERSLWNRPYTLMVFMAAVCGIIHYGTKAIKNRITYPRTGAVEYKTRDTVWRPLVTSFALSTVAAAAAIAYVKSHRDPAVLIAVAGLILAASYARGIARTVRWKWLVVWTMAAASILIPVLPSALLASLVGSSWITRQVPARIVGATWLTLTLYGTLILVSGAISFRIYLRQYPAPDQQ